jgi:DNA polymerase-3 subunit delta
VNRSPLTVIVGDEELLVARAIRDVVDGVRSGDPDTEVISRLPEELTENDLIDIATPSMFGGRRVAVIRSAQDLTDDQRDAVLRYVADPPPEVVLVVGHSGAARNRKIVDAMKAAKATVVSAAKITRARDRHDFLMAEFRRLGGRATDGAVRALAEAVGGDLRELAAVCEQLVADTRGTVDEQVVARFHRGRAEATGFAVADAAIAGDLPEAMTALRQALAGGTAPVLVASAVAGGLRDLARVTGTGGSSWEAARALGMPDWKVDKARRAARGWSDEALARAIRAASGADAAVKGAAADPAYALESLVSQVVSARESARGGRR